MAGPERLGRNRTNLPVVRGEMGVGKAVRPRGLTAAPSHFGESHNVGRARSSSAPLRAGRGGTYCHLFSWQRTSQVASGKASASLVGSLAPCHRKAQT